MPVCNTATNHNHSIKGSFQAHTKCGMVKYVSRHSFCTLTKDSGVIVQNKNIFIQMDTYRNKFNKNTERTWLGTCYPNNKKSFNAYLTVLAVIDSQLKAIRN